MDISCAIFCVPIISSIHGSSWVILKMILSWDDPHFNINETIAYLMTQYLYIELTKQYMTKYQ